MVPASTPRLSKSRCIWYDLIPWLDDCQEKNASFGTKSINASFGTFDWPLQILCVVWYNGSMNDSQESTDASFGTFDQELTAAETIAAHRWGKVSLDRQTRRVLMRQLRALPRRGAAGGRPPSVPHSPGPRGGCRCADCRRSKRSQSSHTTVPPSAQ